MSERISPTAHFTGTVWQRNGLGHPALEGAASSTLYTATRPLSALLSVSADGMSLEKSLVQRHRIVDALLERAIEQQGVRQVVELAAGLSGRGLRFRDRYRDRGLVYVDSDLQGMMERKRGALGPLPEGYTLRTVDVMSPQGPDSLHALVQQLDPALPTAVISEGLVNYFDWPAIEGLWRRVADALGAFPKGVYICSTRVAEAKAPPAPTRFVRWAIQQVASTRLHEHFTEQDDMPAALRGLGFDRAELNTVEQWAPRIPLPHPKGGSLRVIEAWTGPQP